MGFYTGKKILIVGGTGSIGKALINELILEEPSVIRILSRDEFKQFEMQNNIDKVLKNKLRFLIGDVRDYDRVERAMNDIDVVFNLAAMKHVPACEYNPDEAIKTNVNGMQNVIKAAVYNKVEAVIFTSTDKAINPTNAYGATKLLAEKLVQTANFSKGPIDTRFVAVRFGNVMGSRGSVVPLFKNQILEKRRITVTDDKMNRFMMKLSEAVRLTMKAGEIGAGGELFVLKMPVMLLKDLAEVVIEETCKKYNVPIGEVSIENIGLRAGERMYEELMTEEESACAYDLGDMYAVLPTSFHLPEYAEKYSGFPHSPIGVYTSSKQECISKEEVRKLVLEADLL